VWIALLLTVAIATRADTQRRGTGVPHVSLIEHQAVTQAGRPCYTGVLPYQEATRASLASAKSTPERPRYQINLSLDVERGSYTGTEVVRWTNRGDRGTSVVFFHLYSNVRSEQPFPAPAGSSQGSSEAAAEPDEPHIEVSEVKTVPGDLPLLFSLDDQGTTLRVNLRAAVAPGNTIELSLKFKGSVPEIDAEETGLVTHVVKQVSAAIKSERETRRAREINFRSRNVLFLGTAYPVLVVHDSDDWRRKVEPSVGDFLFSEAADYEVAIQTKETVSVFTSAPEAGKPAAEGARSFAGTALRDFAVIAGPGLRVEQRLVGEVTVRSIFLAEHERVGKRVLDNAANATRIFLERFGPLPFQTVSLVEAPLVAGLGSTEFAGFDVIASAFYVDFDSPAMRNMPELIRDQRSSVEDSLEWTVAHLVAHQWWGGVVGNDPARAPVLDEAMAGWSALLYYREVYGEERAATVMQDQLRGVYRLYRTFGGEDLPADRPARDYRNSFQYAAIVMTKGALMFVELEKQLGDKRFFAAVQKYYQANQLEVAEMDDLLGAFVAEAPVEQRRMVARTFNRWLSSRRGDEDIAPPDRQLADSLGLPSKPETQRSGDKNAFTLFGRLGKFFWQQMTRIR
jgi:Peptidase family M1 domain